METFNKNDYGFIENSILVGQLKLYIVCIADHFDV